MEFIMGSYGGGYAEGAPGPAGVWFVSRKGSAGNNGRHDFEGSFEECEKWKRAQMEGEGVMLELTDELQEVDRAALRQVLHSVLLSGGWPTVKASLALAYSRKGYEVSSPVWPEYSAGGRDSGSMDEYVLTVEVRVPKAFQQLDFTELVGDSKAALQKAKTEELEQKRAGLQTELDRVQNAIADLGRI